MSAKKIIIVGGGLAGLAAAYKLTKANYQVELFEKRDLLGGKWSSWQDADGDWIETGLHVFFGAYEEIFTLMKELDIYDRIHWKDHVLTYTLDKGERFEFRTIDLPSPLHLLPAVIKNQFFSWGEKLSLTKALFPMLFGSEKYYQEQDSYTYQEWHRRFGIADRMLKKMFLPMTLALKFLPPEKISAKIVLDVTGTFLRKNTASRIGFLKGSPDTHLMLPIARAIQERGGIIHCNHKLVEIRTSTDEETIRELVFKNGDSHTLIGREADHYILALPIHNLKHLIPEEWDQYDYFKGLKHIESVPVITLNLWLDRQISGIDNILFSPDGHIPVYADMGNTTEEYYCEGRSRFQFVVAPAFNLIEWSDQQIIDRIWSDVQKIYPDTAAEAKILKAQIVRVPESVYWPNVHTDRLRVPQKSPLSNLSLAGGYTIQRFYDSMEGAVRSGNRAADVILAEDQRLTWSVKN